MLMLVLATSGVACTIGESAEHAANHALKVIQQMDTETISRYLEIGELIEQDAYPDDSDSIDEEKIIAALENIKYKINRSKQKRKIAVVNVDITNIDTVTNKVDIKLNRFEKGIVGRVKEIE
jgi:hypothetical protein